MVLDSFIGCAGRWFVMINNSLFTHDTCPYGTHATRPRDTHREHPPHSEANRVFYEDMFSRTYPNNSLVSAEHLYVVAAYTCRVQV